MVRFRVIYAMVMFSVRVRMTGNERKSVHGPNSDRNKNVCHVVFAALVSKLPNQILGFISNFKLNIYLELIPIAQKNCSYFYEVQQNNRRAKHRSSSDSECRLIQFYVL